jgi:hypothetical protein
MSSWNKTTFNHTLITSQFLNDLQDYIMLLEDRIEALEARPQMIPYEESPENVIPATSGVTASLTLQGVLIDRDVVVGDIFVGTEGSYLAEVTATDGQYATVIGLGKRF